MTFIGQLPRPKMLIVRLLAPVHAFCRPCPVSSGKSFLTLCLFSYGRGEGAELQKRPREGLGLASGPCLHPAHQHWSETRACSAFPGSGGWASCSSLLRKRGQSGNYICNRPRSAQRWLQEELPFQEEGRRSVAHIRTCLFLPDAGERCPRHSVIARRGLSFTLGQILWRTLVCRAGHTLTGTQYLPPTHTHTYTQGLRNEATSY